MKLKKLDLVGFKSFSEKSCIHFPPGISAVVGPNGCGKSNVLDALRWVMGEQSVKQLRGKSMEDVIFSGTRGQQQLNMAEVSLTLINDNGSAPEVLRDYAEINITRRLYRSGESAYLLNKQPCRLKDIHNIFLGSGMGARSYSMIQQGNIGAITDANPEERRFFVEEAAGVTRYKSRKTEALRKVKKTQQNLLRVTDIISEVHRQMNGLKRQARKAELFKKYQEQIREIDVQLAVYNHDGLSGEIHEADTLLTQLKDTDIAHSSELKQLDAAVEEIKLKRWQKNQLISEQKSKQFETRRQIDRWENDMSHLRKEIERLGQEVTSLSAVCQELEEKNQGILAEIDQAEVEIADTNKEMENVHSTLNREQAASEEIGRQLSNLNQALERCKKELTDLTAQEAQYQNVYQHATNTKESLKRRLRQADEQEALARKAVSELGNRTAKAQAELEALQDEISKITEKITSAEATLHEKRSALGAQVKLFHTLELERKTIRSRYTTLKKMEENFEWYRDGVKAIMTADHSDAAVQAGSAPPDPSTILGLMADIIQPKPSFETAVEAVLGESLQYVLVTDPQVGMDAISFLQTSESGRSGFVPMSAIKPACEGYGKPIDPDHALLNKVSVKTGYEAVAQALLGHVVVAEDLNQALKIRQANGAFTAIVTKNGDVINPQGVMIGGSQDKLSGILVKKQEMRDLKEKILQLDTQIQIAEKRQIVLETQVRAAESTLQQLIERKNDTVQDELEAQKALYKVSEELKHGRHRLEVVQLEQEQLMGEESDVDQEITKFEKVLDELVLKSLQKQDEATDIASRIEAVQFEVEEYNQRTMDLKLKQSSLTAKLDNSRSTLKRLKDFQHDANERLEQLKSDISVKKTKQEASQEMVSEQGQRLSGMYEAIKSLDAELEGNEAEYQTISEKLKDKDSAISQLQSKREEVLQKTRILEVEQSQRQIKRENVISRLEERYQQPFAELKQFYGLDSDGDSQAAAEKPPREKLEVDLERLRKRMTHVGDVNLGAIQEYEEFKERYDFLVAQQTDLNQAIEDLHRVIKKINHITQERFLNTLKRVNEKLVEVFPRLFAGGTAELVLTEPDKPLDSGVEFMVHPPGKKVTRLSLLSGGEKALSAIAFIFSIFLIKPASFCLMDEIDAPLDDANINRFNELLRMIGEKSQIVMITHNKRSMEFADTLFGITMEKKGISKVVSVNLERRAA